MKQIRTPLNGRERAEFGFVVTFENADGQKLTLHRMGLPTDLLAAACDHALSLDPSYRVVSYSTPMTILGDLVGLRGVYVDKKGAREVHALPELAVLAKIDRREMLHPRLQRANSEANLAKKRRAKASKGQTA